VSKTSSRRTEFRRGVTPFSVRSSHHADMRTIALFGELDLATAPTLERELQAAEAVNARVIVLDLRELEFIDSTGLQLIVEAHRRGRGQLLLLGCSERVQRPFELCGLLELLTFVDEIPARNTAKTGAGDVVAAAADRSGTLRAATLRRATRPRWPAPERRRARMS
jgi:anti-sigma B factor antagonist